jgi:hypothetical protein
MPTAYSIFLTKTEFPLSRTSMSSWQLGATRTQETSIRQNPTKAVHPQLTCTITLKMLGDCLHLRLPESDSGLWLRALHSADPAPDCPDMCCHCNEETLHVSRSSQFWSNIFWVEVRRVRNWLGYTGTLQEGYPLISMGGRKEMDPCTCQWECRHNGEYIHLQESKWQVEREKCIIRSFIICMQVTKVEMGGICCAHGKDEKCIQNSGRNPCRKQTTLRTTCKCKG